MLCMSAQLFLLENVHLSKKVCKQNVHLVVTTCIQKLQICALIVQKIQKVLCTISQIDKIGPSNKAVLKTKKGTVSGMEKTKRIEEIVNAMKSFSKDKYYKSEVLPELFALQQEVVDLTFNDVHASSADLKIWDVERHLKELNQDCGGIADEELEHFLKGSRALCNLIKAEVSGARGESKAFHALDFLARKNIVVKNVELADGDIRTELDAVVITPDGLTIVEVKNTARDIFIDENGSYYRTGEYLRFDSNIAEKLDTKERLLRGAIANVEIPELKVNRIVVFTNNRIEVQNKYLGIRTCFVTQLASIIDDLESEQSISEELMGQIAREIELAECKEAYPLRFDVEQFKRDFALVMAILEDASADEAESERIEAYSEPAEEKEVFREKKEKRQWRWKWLKPEFVSFAGSATAVLTFATLATIEMIGKGALR